MSDDGPTQVDTTRWSRHQERLTVPARWWLAALAVAVIASVAVALWRGPEPRMLVGLPVLMALVVAIGLGYAGSIRVVVAEGAVTTRPRAFRFAVDDIVDLEVVQGPALRQERDDHALTNRVHAPPWVDTAVVVVVEGDDGRWQDYVVGTRRLDDLLRALTTNRTDGRVPAQSQVRSAPLASSPSLRTVREHSVALREDRGGS